MRVLIVDESQDMRSTLAGIMGDLGFEVLEAGCGSEALVLAAQGHVELALINWHLTGMDGLSLVKALRAMPQSCGTEFVMVTAHSELTKLARNRTDTAGESVLAALTRDAIIGKLEILGLATA
jgi:two-component system, chemotaxis family, chemotaxis protein CheY